MADERVDILDVQVDRHRRAFERFGRERAPLRQPAEYPNGRVFTDDVINYRIAFLTKNQCPPTGLKPHTDVLKEFPYLGTPHSK